jgi:hypothetical protein
MNTVVWLSLATSLILFGSLIAQACNVPVFRFALEHWRSDPYRVTLLHRGPLSQEQQKLLAELEARQANVAVRAVDVAELAAESDENAADRGLLASPQQPALPRLVVQYPQHLKIEAAIWSASLARESVDGLLASPLRKQLIERLAAGQTAVWLLLESGDAAKDAAAFELLTAELKKLEAELELPELTDAPADDLLAAPPLGLTFSLLRVPRGAAEAALVEMLLHSEPDLIEYDEPMVFPVFGRGRALLPLVGAGVTAENIRGSAGFLVGACSCEVKELNPGFDLLLAADWDSLLFQDGKAPPDPTSSDLTSREPAADAPPVLVPIPAGSPPPASAAPPAPAVGGSPTTSVTVPVVVDSSLGGTLQAFLSTSNAWIIGGIAGVCLLLAMGLLAMGLLGGSGLFGGGSRPEPRP